jgi:class 3 adenylate cyclase
MASFDDAAASVQCARAIQQAFEAFNLASKEKLQVRIGIDVGEPIADSDDLFGATVQLAARLCQLAEPDAILVSSAVQDRIEDRSQIASVGPRHLKGFPSSVDVYRVEWR